MEEVAAACCDLGCTCRPALTGGTYTQPRHLQDIWAHSEVIEPRWLRPQTTGIDNGNKYPANVEVLVTAEGRDLILSLQRNILLVSLNYTQTYYSQKDTPITWSPNMTEHCYYHGVVQGQTGSSVAVSTCSGLRGLIILNSNVSYIVEPLSDASGRHLIYKTEHLHLGGLKCGQQNNETDDGLLVPISDMTYHKRFQKNDFDLDKTQQKMLEVTNYIDKFYRALKIRIALVGLEVWTGGDKCNVSENPYSTLRSFLSWRRKLLPQRPHDNAQLITGQSFHGTTIGLAPLQAMCSTYQSGGVNMDHSDNAIGVAATMAHEMGHNFGMSHDGAGCCSAKPEDGGCIMAAATGHPFPKVFNACNRKELDRFLRSGGGMCLSNTPDTKTLYGGARCGNGFLEEGEECDCGDIEECDNPCCNATTCTLLAGAECAHGTCCHRCKLKPPGFPCRKTSRSCDLPEFCTGRSAICPPNSFQMDGASCQGGQAFCYNGRCLTHEQQCRQLWGAGTHTAPDQCFEKINAAGDQYGNCGRDINGEYRKCEARDAKCGKIQCLSLASKPLENNAVAIDTTIIMDGRRVRCRGTHVYRAPEEEDMMDPGLVLTGTKCGENQICFEGQCRNTSFLQADVCAKKCNGNGICNNNQNCHCFAGWQPPFCNQSGNGGSIDSGPLPAESSVMPWIYIPGALLIGMALSLSIYFYQFRNKGRLAKSTSSNAACAPHNSNGQVKPSHGFISGQRPLKQTCAQSPVLFPSNLKRNNEAVAAPDCSKGSPATDGAAKKVLPVRIPPPSRPAPRPPAHIAVKRLDPPRRAPPPIPPTRSRQKANMGDL
ncbi:disintegrin and metalloproteinase domain-containing protein 19 isoform X2 [Bombina bombina]|uniref:disintegrin and metalloproteinase domain-containing protein 19 isoform X2 n=1 Tax=Bombina bombina TaxID=8345 RepID=UPI00235B24A2|nr:disintegrin and metalloproteinase domain-containing protein 19 isoform X2 [Bombina bombina]